jgi:hypothetical protein
LININIVINVDENNDDNDNDNDNYDGENNNDITVSANNSCHFCVISEMWSQVLRALINMIENEVEPLEINMGPFPGLKCQSRDGLPVPQSKIQLSSRLHKIKSTL